MLGPEYLAQLPDALCSLWRQVEDDILRDIARRITAADGMTETAVWQAQRMELLRTVQNDTVNTLAKYAKRSRSEIRRLLTEAGTATLAADDAIHRAAGKNAVPVNESPTLLNLLNAGYRQTLGSWQNLTATTAATVTGELEQRLDRAWLQVSTGAIDYNTAIRGAVDDLADGMKYVTYPTGHRDTLETAVRRCVLTGVNQTAAKLQLTRMEELGCEFVEVTAHEGARPSHAVWQGKIYHIGGAVTLDGVRYEDFAKATGYGTGAGLCGWNCRHNFYPYWPGISVPNYTETRLAALNAKGDPLFEKLQTIIDGDLVLDDLKTDIVEVKLWGEASAGAYPAIKEECYIEVSSYGGDTTGYQIPFNVHYTGVKTKGTFDVSKKTFTPAG